MDVKSILESFKKGELSADEAEKLLRMDYIDSIGDSVLFDSSRHLRTGIPEVVYANSKKPETVLEIVRKRDSGILLISKAKDEHLDLLEKGIPEIRIFRECGMAVKGEFPEKKKGRIGIITAGTSDIPIAMEAKLMAEAMGIECITFFDIGVAGLHRILEPMQKLIESHVSAIVVVAGMEGALPTVVSSLSPVPVIGVPTSIGYGYGGNGECALMSMLQSCSPGLSVVNIDNGIGAGATAALIAGNRSDVP